MMMGVCAVAKRERVTYTRAHKGGITFQKGSSYFLCVKLVLPLFEISTFSVWFNLNHEKLVRADLVATFVRNRFVRLQTYGI